MGNQMNGFCEGALTAYPIDSFLPGLPPNEIGLVMAISGILNILMSLGTVFWIKRKEWEAQQEGGGDDAAKSVIFPVFVVVVWGNVLANIYAGFVVALVPLDPAGNNTFSYALLYASQTAFHHIVTEGIAFLLMQKGCGYNAGKEAGKLAFLWGLLTFIIMFFIYHEASDIAEAVNLVWDFVMAIFYGSLWMMPQERLYRRPALISFSKFWFWYRLCAMLINVLLFSPATAGAGSCSYIVVQIVFFSVFQPLVCYWTLLQDSRWWQGLDIGDQTVNGRAPSYENIRSPLLGSDFSLTTAQSLAATMDQIRVQGHVKMLNFACIKIDFNKPLGSGSFSKVCRGSYRGKECAIKLIYTVDLTTDVIRRVAAEASILSSIRHPNIVHIYGVSVLPPSVCLILEICSFGSLSDIIRGYGFDWSTSSRAPLSLAYADVLHLALGCARGLAAVHAYDRYLCHRDVKSFNFLVDHQFNVKIADLELGVRDKEDVSRRRRTGSRQSGRTNRRREERTAQGWRSWLSSVSSSTANTLFPSDRGDDHNDEATLLSNQSRHHLTQALDGGMGDDDGSVGTGRSGHSTGSYSSHTSRNHLDAKDQNLVDELLANWMAPEVVTHRKFQQPSDVYALGTVMWEILAKQLPFEQCQTQREIRQLIVSGYQHPIPVEAQDSPLAYIIQQCWNMDPSRRPKAIDVVRFLEKILYEDVFRSRIPEGFIAHAPDFTTMMHYYEACYRKATVSDVQSQLRLHVPNDPDGGKGGFFARFWGIFSRGGGDNRRRRPHSSSTYSASRASSSRATSGARHPSAMSNGRDSGTNKVLSMLNPNANHYEEDDDADFAFTLPSYSVRGSELNSSATALSVAADLRSSMKGRRSLQQQQQQQKQKERDGRKGGVHPPGVTNKRATSTDAVAADKVDNEPHRRSPKSMIRKAPARDDVDMDLDSDVAADDIGSHNSRSHRSGDDAEEEEEEEEDDDDDDDDDDEDDRQQSNDGYMSSLARLAMPMPPAAMDAVRMVKEESYWYELEASREAWAVVTPKAPYIIVHGTKTWFQRFSQVTSTPASGFAGPDAPMLSLLALLAPEIEAMPQQTHATNSYVQLAAQQTPALSPDGGSRTVGEGETNGFRKMRSASAKEVLKALQRQEEYHGVLALHMPNIQAATNRPFHHLSSGSTNAHSASTRSGESGSLMSLSRTYSSHLGNASVAVDASGRLSGVNTMFSVHIYPVHYNRAIAMANTDSIDSNAAYNVAAQVPTSGTEATIAPVDITGGAAAAAAAAPVVAEEPLLLPPLHQTTQPDAPHLFNAPVTSPALPSSPKRTPMPTTDMPSSTEDRPSTSAAPMTPSRGGRIASYIDDFRSKQGLTPTAATTPPPPSVAAHSAVDISSVQAQAPSASAVAAPRTTTSKIVGDNHSQGPSNHTTTSRTSFFTSRTSLGPNAVKGNIPGPGRDDRQLIYYAILFHELREQSEQFLHPPTPSAPTAASTVGRFFSRSAVPTGESKQPHEDQVFDEADAARTMSRTYSRNASRHGLQRDIYRMDEEDEEQSVSLAEEEDDYVRRYRESSSGGSIPSLSNSRSGSVNPPLNTATSAVPSSMMYGDKEHGVEEGL